MIVQWRRATTLSSRTATPKDKPLAAALQRVVQTLGKPWYRRRALRVFRDDASLSTTPQLWPAIERALRQSRFLIFLASPQSAASRWCSREVEFWLEHKSIDTLMIVLTEGELHWDETAGDFAFTASTPLPAALKGRYKSEPKWADMRAFRAGVALRNAAFLDLAADIASAIHGVPQKICCRRSWRSSVVRSPWPGRRPARC